MATRRLRENPRPSRSRNMGNGVLSLRRNLPGDRAKELAIENTRAFQTITCPAHRLTRVEVGQLQSHNWREILEEIRKAKLAK
jgi:hypothetical protein